MPQQLWAAIILAAVLAIVLLAGGITRKHSAQSRVGQNSWTGAGLRRSGALGLFVGADNRVSTSKTIALLWTFVLGYCLLALVLVSTARVSAVMPPPPDQIPMGFVNAAFTPLAPSYLALLGGPFAAAVAAKGLVTSRITKGRLQKTTAATPRLSDVVTNDSGTLDLVDFQYTLFNLIAAIFVLTQFIPHPAHGIPSLPAAFAVLTGVSAAVYVSNKAISDNSPSISLVSPAVVRPGRTVQIWGANLIVDEAPISASGKTGASIEITPADTAGPDSPGAEAVTVAPNKPASASRLEFTVPTAMVSGTYDVTVMTNANASVCQPAALQVLPATTALDQTTSAKPPTGQPIQDVLATAPLGVDLGDGKAPRTDARDSQ